jgi:hypothetical protein
MDVTLSAVMDLIDVIHMSNLLNNACPSNHEATTLDISNSEMKETLHCSC